MDEKQNQVVASHQMSLPRVPSVNYQFVCDPAQNYEKEDDSHQPIVNPKATALHKMATACMLGSFESLLEYTRAHETTTSSSAPVPRVYANMCGLGVPVYASPVDSVQLQQLHTDSNRVYSEYDHGMLAHTVISTCEFTRKILIVAESHNNDYSSKHVGFSTDSNALVVDQSLIEQLRMNIEQHSKAKIVIIPPWSNFYMHRHLVHAGTPHCKKDFPENQQQNLLHEHQSMSKLSDQFQSGNSKNKFINVDRTFTDDETPFATAYFSHFSLVPNDPYTLGAAFQVSKTLPFLTKNGFVWKDGTARTKLWMNPIDFRERHKGYISE